MSSLSNKVFEFKPLAEAKDFKIKEALSRSNHYLPKAYLDFINWLSRFQDKNQARLLEVDLLSFAGDHGVIKDLGGARFRTGDFLLECLKSPDKNLSQALSSQKIKVHHYWLDLGIDFQFESSLHYWLNHSNKLVNSKVKGGTESFALYPSMTDTEMAEAFYNGQKFVDRSVYHQRDLLILHSLGEAQLYSVYALAWALSASDAEHWSQLFPHTLKLSRRSEIQRLAKRHPLSHDPFTNLCFYGGLEIVALCGAILRCAEKGIPFVLSDPGSIIAWQYAAKIAPGIEHYGFAIGEIAGHLADSFNTLREPMAYSPEAMDWEVFLLRLSNLIPKLKP